MPTYQFADFTFDDSRGVLTKYPQSNSEQVVQLRHKVANLLGYLIEHRARLISKEELLSELWQQGDYRENSLTQGIRELRLALGDKAKDASFIKTYPQRGYQWICPLETSNLAQQQANNDPVSAPLLLNQEQTKNKAISLAMIAVAVLLLITFTLWYSLKVNDEQVAGHPQPARIQGIDSLVVLPFVNATQDASMAWLELGLADMLAIDMQGASRRQNRPLQITPPAIANALLLDAQLQWPALPVHIRSLLRDQGIQAALFASVRLHKQQQVLDFQIIYADGKTKQGSISYLSLPGAVQSISQQLLHVVQSGKHKIQSINSTNPIAAQALAKGMQALQQSGALQAKKYFQASVLLEQTNYWAKAYLASSHFALGQWQQAQQLFAQIPSSVRQQDLNLDAFIEYWLAELAYRRGSADVKQGVANAITKAEVAIDAKALARGYRLQAKIAWQQMDWAGHRAGLAKAQQAFATNNELLIEADKLFYLGNPTNGGLEKDPQNNLQVNQEYLLKALNFYQQLGNQSKLAASYFAIAQNYSFDLDTRAARLEQAIALYSELQQVYELAQVLVYAGFYQIQLHNGQLASRYFSRASKIAQDLEAKPLLQTIQLYQAFATLDQGLDQLALGGHGKDEQKLRQAIAQLNTFMATKPNAIMQANALVFLGWANTDLGQFDSALAQLSQAKKINSQLNMATTFGYSSYSIMRIHLTRGNYDGVIAMKDDAITTRLQAVFLARAYYEKGQIAQAIQVLEKFKMKLPGMWQAQDDGKLKQYQAALVGRQLILDEEPLAHLIYCESDWAH